MKLKQLYRLIIEEGMRADPRSSAVLRRKLFHQKKLYAQAKGSFRRFFDKERLLNPYSDTRILNGTGREDIRRMLIGIDIEVGEILLAHHFNAQGQKIDLVFSHHPEGKALADLPGVMDLQIDILKQAGLKEFVAKEALERRIEEVSRGLHGKNHTRAVDVARLLKIPFLCCHTPADNHVVSYLQKMMDRKKPKTLKQIIDWLLKEPEYQDSLKNNVAPRILCGKPNDNVGKVLVDMTGGTEGSKDLFARLSQAGIQTLLCMHLSEAHFQRVKSEHIHVIVAGHMASDNLGINLLLDQIEKKEQLEFVPVSGFGRFRR